MQEVFFYYVVDYVDQWGVEIVYVQEGVWFVVDVELVLGEYFEDFFYCVEVVGQGNECVGQVEYV